MGDYHYTMSGLSNVYLRRGVHFRKTPYGEGVAFSDIDGLHREIGRVLTELKKDITGRELRFLRIEMDLSQLQLAKLLGVSEQTIHRWEAGKTDIPKPAESLIRICYRSKRDHSPAENMLRDMAEIVGIDSTDLRFIFSRRLGWSFAAPTKSGFNP